MKIKLNYISLILIHIAIAVCVFSVPLLSKVYSLLIFVISFFYIIKTGNNNNEVLYVSAYVVGSEVFLRMTEGNIFNELAKYSVILFMLMGMFYKGFSRNAIPYWIFILLFLPALFVSTQTLNFETDMRKAIAFNISGPVCLAISSIYCYQRKIKLQEIANILFALGLPILSITTYLFLFTPNIRDVVTNTQSNFMTSGGYGPNQVSTILGLGMFLFFSRFLLASKQKNVFFVNLFITAVIAYRCIITFSRGGMYTGIFMMFFLTLVVCFFANNKGRGKLFLASIGFFFLSLGVWMYSSYQTSGLIDKRYANENIHGVKKESELSGREALIGSEIQMFLDSPIFGVGIGKNKEYREEMTGIEAASHNEISRMVAEQGSFGILALLILLITPLILYVDNKQHIYTLSFFIFWLLTINHAAMRLAAPAFVYALSLLKVYANEKPALHRE